MDIDTFPDKFVFTFPGDLRWNILHSVGDGAIHSVELVLCTIQRL
jgi:hypothetical protein